MKDLPQRVVRGLVLVMTNAQRFYGALRRISPSQWVPHLATLVAAVLAFVIAQLRLPSAPAEAAIDAPQTLRYADSPLVLGAELRARGVTNFTPRSLKARTPAQDLVVRDFALDVAPSAAEARRAVITYTVAPGDNVERIAQRFGLQPTTIIWSNPELEETPDLLRIGQVLTILPVDGLLYEVKPNDTLSSIAERFKVKPEAIVEFPLNNLAPGDNLVPGQKIIVPGGVKPIQRRVITPQPQRTPGRRYVGPAPSFAATGAFGWPTVGAITQQYWWGHRGLDIANAIGTPIAASDGGYVTYAGWNNQGYGNLVIIDHGNGFSTFYAHLSSWFVAPGQSVARGQVIGAMGSTGRSTGPHLHFEIRYNGTPMNPILYLP